MPQSSDVFLGHSGEPLSSPGRQQASRCHERLSGLGSAVVFTSDLPRALETATAIARAGYPLVLTPLLRERCYGSWEGLTPADASSRDPDLFRRWRQAPHGVTPPGGESHQELAARVARFTRQLPAGTVVVVSHLGPLRLLIGRCLGWPLPAVRSVMLDHASLSALTVTSGLGQATVLNDTCHLLPRPD